jgi:hypothetical protein
MSIKNIEEDNEGESKKKKKNKKKFDLHKFENVDFNAYAAVLKIMPDIIINK